MKIIGITGYKGKLGRHLLKHHANFVALECDVTGQEQVENCLRHIRPDFVLHLAAKSDVDFCERSENEKLVKDVNVVGTYNICHTAQGLGLPVILLSSDHVFGGVWGMYKETSKGHPVNYYGLTKQAAESLHVVFDNLKVIRTSYLFDVERLTPYLSGLWNGVPALYPTFISRTFLHFSHFAESLDYYFNHFEKMPRILHISGTKSVSWFDFMTQLAKRYGIVNYRKLVVPKVQESISKAPRPSHGGLNTKVARKLGFPQYSYLDGFDLMVSK